MQPEIVAVGFQEIVELSPQQIMSTDPARRQTWEHAVKKTLNDNSRKSGKEEYVLLRSGQLVGAALLIFVKTSVLVDIKDVEGSVKKVGAVLSLQAFVSSISTNFDTDRNVRSGGQQRSRGNSYGFR